MHSTAVAVLPVFSASAISGVKAARPGLLEEVAAQQMPSPPMSVRRPITSAAPRFAASWATSFFGRSAFPACEYGMSKVSVRMDRPAGHDGLIRRARSSVRILVGRSERFA
ncbi:hypothetical protein [Streptomyces cuspidosporus]|uniref:hypothetical protein n=1 Tax=Streptomyces cuspidosporus TaxID=66882 RepID=UPI0031FDACD6